ncbi:MAG: OsmC family protein [Flavobacterium sp.]|nr:OsmC family protein [Flavobacterium sp.]
MTSKVTYLGDLRTSSEHIQSGTIILSDPPVDNNGRGEAFSPTDLLANALGSCMLTIMAIKARDLNIDLTNSTVEVSKFMQTEPRKVSKIGIVMNMNINPDDKNKIILERTAMNCPVLLSLNPDIEKDIVINWRN